MRRGEDIKEEEKGVDEEYEARGIGMKGILGNKRRDGKGR